MSSVQKKKTSRKPVLILLAFLCLLIGSIIVLKLTTGGSVALSPEKLRLFDSQTISDRSNASETESRQKFDELHFADKGLRFEGQSYFDYCEQGDEGDSFYGHLFYKQCKQHAVVYLSTASSPKDTLNALEATLDESGQFFSAYDKSATCPAGQLSIKSSQRNIESRAGNFTITPDSQGRFLVLPLGVQLAEKSCSTAFKNIPVPENDNAWSPNRFYLKAQPLDEAAIIHKISQNGRKTLVVIVFDKQYYKEELSK